MKKPYMYCGTDRKMHPIEGRCYKVEVPEEFSEHEFIAHKSGSGWTITHVQTGAAIGRTNSLDSAKTYAYNTLLYIGIEKFNESVAQIRRLKDED